MTEEKDRSGYHHGDLRAALVAEARGLLEERGVEQLSLREVARRAGVSRAAPYHHFKNKEAMVAAVAEAGFRELHASMGAPADATAAARLECGGRAYMTFALDNPTVYRLMFGSKIGSMDEHPGLDTAAKAAFGQLVERIAEALPNEAEPEVRAMAVWGAVHGMASLLIDNLGPLDACGNRERWVEASMELIRHGLYDR
ncbi:MAG: TetR/AcrR family transcriptional regulator [Myxococcota bacterium]